MIRIASFLLAAAILFASAAPLAGSAKQPERTRTLLGKVFDRQERPLSKAIVYLKNSRTAEVKTYITDADGSYRFPALSPDVDYQVYAEFNGARSDTKTLSLLDPRKQVEITLRIR